MSLNNTPIANGAALPFTPPTGGTGGATTQAFAAIGIGSFTANSTSAVTVADAGVTAASVVVFTPTTITGGAPAAAPYVATITPGTGFTVKAGSGDTSVYRYMRIG